MFNPSRRNPSARALVMLGVLASVAGLSSCLENTGIAAKAGYTLSKSQANCALPDAASVKNIGQRLAASAVVVGVDFCAKPDGYECYVRKFSPTTIAGQSVVEECPHVAELGGDICYNLKSVGFNTRAAARAPGVSASASQPGGDFNRSEYVCHQHDLKDGENYLAVGEGDTLRDALANAYAKCAGVAPRLAAGK